ncbi:MAG: succinylglutamate desuccinylase [Lachnospiraceae bacterium]|nr:succinylglutamate desuccinylase [Lachnospiraceae bacterium]
MDKKKLNAVKAISLAVVVFAMSVAGCLFYEHRNYKEPVVVSEYITEVKKLSDYSDVIKGTVNDCNVYIFDSGIEGGCMLIWGGTHAEEPAGVMAANIFTENLKVTQGKVIIIDRENTSASTNTRVGEAYPRFFTYETDWGTKVWRYGDRHANQLDSWPDPEVYIHYPSGQTLANVDIRNTNRNWPGKADGLLTERTNYAIMQLIDAEGVDMTLDFHEAELEYTVENTIVVHEKGNEVAAMTSMLLTSQTFDVAIGMEFSPVALHGLSHREIGDYSDAASYLVEVAEPMLDRIRGITDEELLMSGKDIFVIKAGEHGLLYAPIDEEGWPIEKRVARHVATATTLMEVNNTVHPDQTILIENIPTYDEMMEEGLGSYFHNPDTAPAERVYYD